MPLLGAVQLSGSRAEKEELNVEVDVKDSGMMIVTTVAPELQWIGGAAHLQFTCGTDTLSLKPGSNGSACFC